METRIERYRIYRNEIINESLLLDRLVDETSISKQYKTRIDDLDPSILADIHIDKSIARLISINENEMQESKQMMHFMELIDEKRIQQVTKEITEWSDKNRMQLIIDQNGNVNRQWLFEDPAYVAFKDNEKKIQTQNNNWTNFQANSQTQISKINELSKLADNANVIAQLKSIHLYEDKKVSFNKIIYLVPSILSILFLLGIVVLLVIIITRL